MTTDRAGNGVEVTLRLRGSHELTTVLMPGSPVLSELRQLKQSSPGRVIQVPLQGGAESLSICSVDIRALRFPRAGEHPTMNVGEGHLGGYISARHPRSAELGTLNGDPATWTPTLWQWMKNQLDIGSVLDVGCGEGHAADFFRALGCRVCGVDGSEMAQRDSVLGDDHIKHDYSTGSFVPDASFDLVWCCEFVEHVDEVYVPNFLASFNCARRYLFITAAPPGQPGWHHVNCQPPEYWIDRIEALGFTLDSELTRNAKELAERGHFARMGMAFIRNG